MLVGAGSELKCGCRVPVISSGRCQECSQDTKDHQHQDTLPSVDVEFSCESGLDSAFIISIIVNDVS